MKKNTEIKQYDATGIYEKEIEKHIAEIKRICTINEIPMLITVAVKNDEKETVYRNDGVTLGSLGINLTDDKLSKYLCVARGFDVKAPGVENKYNDLSAVDDEEFNDEELEEIPEELL